MRRIGVRTTALLFVLACGSEPPPEPAAVARPVKILEVGGGVAFTREYPGTIAAFQEAEVGFEVPGRVTSFLVREGDRVSEGQELAHLDARDYEASLDSAAAYRQARKAVEDTRVRAPFDGVVARKLVADFVNVRAKEPCCS